jgi:hypothetical protein
MQATAAAPVTVELVNSWLTGRPNVYNLRFSHHVGRTRSAGVWSRGPAQEEQMAKKRAGKPKSRATKAGSKGRTTMREAAYEPHPEDHIDACDCEFTESDATPDAALPPARGGVATVGRARR